MLPLLLQLIRLDHLLVFLGLVHAEIIQNFATLGDFAEETTARAFILWMLLEMFRKEIDLVTEDRNLHVRRTSVLIVDLVLRDELFLDCARKHRENPFEGALHPSKVRFF